MRRARFAPRPDHRADARDPSRRERGAPARGAVLDGTIYSLREQLSLDECPRLFRDDGTPRPPPMTTGSPTAPRASPPPPRRPRPARADGPRMISRVSCSHGGGNARAHQQLQVVAQVIRDNCLDGEMLSTEYESLESVMAMLREECSASGGQLDGPRYTRVAKLLRELLLDPEKERQHRADVQRLSREQRDALYSPKFERAPAAASPPWSGGQEMKLQSEMLQTVPAADPRATAELEMLRQSHAESKARIVEAEARARIVEAEAKARIESETTKARVESEANKARIVEVEAKARIEAEARARIEAEANKSRIVEIEAKARVEAANKAQVEAEHKARLAEQEMKAKLEQQELRARLEQELKIKELELKVKAEASSESVPASPQRDMQAIFEQMARERANTQKEQMDMVLAEMRQMQSRLADAEASKQRESAKAAEAVRALEAEKSKVEAAARARVHEETTIEAPKVLHEQFQAVSEPPKPATPPPRTLEVSQPRSATLERPPLANASAAQVALAIADLGEAYKNYAKAARENGSAVKYCSASRMTRMVRFRSVSR